MNRYMRQTSLPEIGTHGQEILSRSSVLCIGAGGLGSPALLYLAAAGIGTLGILDDDAVEESNLQRQVLFSMEDIGKSKALRAKERLAQLNPKITIEAHRTRLDAANAEEWFKRYDIILDGTDNFETKFLINDAALKYNKPWVYGAIQGFDGQVSVFNPQHGGPCYRCLYPDVPKTPVANCAEAGVIGAVAGVIGTLQALQVIQTLLGTDSFRTLEGKLWTIDTRSMETHCLRLPKKSSCPLCSAKDKYSIVLAAPAAAPACHAVRQYPAAGLQHTAFDLILDVREQEEWDNGHIPHARHLALSHIEQGRTPESAADAAILLYCQKGIRSLRAARLLQERGFTRVASLAGGFECWCEENR